MSLLDREPFASFFGRGKASITVPVLDGAFRPNDMLEKAEVVLALAGVDCLAVDQGRLYASAGAAVYQITEGQPREIARFAASISALAVAEGVIAVGLDSGGLYLRAPDGQIRALDRVSCHCPTALLLREGKLYCADGSSVTRPSDWSRDLLERHRTGRVLEVDLASGEARVLAAKLAYANGLAWGLVMSQPWSHSLAAVSAPLRPLLGGLAGYGGRLSPAADGGHWLAVFGMRTQLLEFVLREDAYRRRMIDEVAPEHWIAPALTARENFLDPLQQGAAKQLGIKKPWAPPRSYGLVVKLTATFEPKFSFHSRVGGSRHGITSAVEHEGALYIASKGLGTVLRLNVAEATREVAE